MRSFCLFFFFFNDTATTEIYTLSLHDALPICLGGRPVRRTARPAAQRVLRAGDRTAEADRKSTRLNSSHQILSYDVFCLKKIIPMEQIKTLAPTQVHNDKQAAHDQKT